MPYRAIKGGFSSFFSHKKKAKINNMAKKKKENQSPTSAASQVEVPKKILSPAKKVDKQTVVSVLEGIATLLELKGENPFKSRAYRTAARVIDSLAEELDELVAQGRLKGIKGIGEGIGEKITQLITTGSLPYYEELKKEFPASLLELLEIPGVGPKRAKILYEELGIKDIDSLEKACKEHRIAVLAGFGPKSEENILLGISQYRSFAAYHRYGDLINIVEELLGYLKKNPSIIHVHVAGSFRRGKEIVKDLDFICTSGTPQAVMDYFVRFPQVSRIVNHGETKSTVLLEKGISCDLRVVPDEDYAYALLHFTGSKEHNVALRQRAIAQGKKLSEWGLFRVSRAQERETAEGESEDNPKLVQPFESKIPCRSEKEIYAALGLAYIPPELRENMGEIEAAEKNEIPRLVEWEDIRGVFHCHTTESDGRSSLEEMAKAAMDMGLEYLGIADHSKSSFQANGLSEERVYAQMEKIKNMNAQWKNFRLLSGIECDILKEGKLDFPDSLLKELDYVVASLHAGFSGDEEDNTQRLIKAMENPYVTMLGHPTGRLLLVRKPYPVNMDKVIDCAARTGCWIELNAQPMRLDMDWRLWKTARDKGVKCVINPDAHHFKEIAFFKIGVNIARKGWLRKEDVINCLPLKEVIQALQIKGRKKKGF
ncbi:DNA polymerase/3'-5' exonuclease PolX [Candidatus Methylacidiphilum infernorum]|uniref:DNA polymerase beta n=2 Tax=Candidatus Methylacidiphilum infernorum TaxID=511746 RepID=A0ABX7PWM4_9BACT|nr:DNA polymerase/3'-5' exonuclease PolX [Candidatus Methylacidiphilum infernorum]